MGRSGVGGGGHSSGMSHSSGSRGFSRSGGSSSRSGAGSGPSRSGGGFGGFGGGFNFGGGCFRPPRPYGGVHVHNHYGPSYGYRREYTMSRRGGSIVGGIFTLVIILFFLAVMLIAQSGSAGGVQSTIQREKLSNPNAWVSNCVVDELGWVGSRSKMEKGMKQFYDKTGVQPYVVLTYETADLSTSAAREAWAQQYFDENCATSGFLYVYFETSNPNMKGPDVVWWGSAASAVLDNEAVDIFLNYLDSYWETWDADDTSGMFGQIYSKTADTIMKVSTTGKDVMKYAIIAVIVIAIGVFAIVLFNKKRKAERERADETERILQAGQNQAQFGSSGDDMEDLTSKYD